MSLSAKELREFKEHLNAINALAQIAEARLKGKMKGWVRSYNGQNLEELLENCKYIGMDSDGSTFAYEFKPIWQEGLNGEGHWDSDKGSIQMLWDSLVYEGKAKNSLIRVKDLLGEGASDEP